MDIQEAIEYIRKESYKQPINSDGQDAYIIAISSMQNVNEYIKQGIDNCYMTQRFGNPGMEDGMCAGFRILDGNGEPCEICKNCKLLYLDKYDRNEE